MRTPPLEKSKRTRSSSPSLSLTAFESSTTPTIDDDIQCDELSCEHDPREVETNVFVCQRCGEYISNEYDGRGDEPQTVEPN